MQSFFGEMFSLDSKNVNLIGAKGEIDFLILGKNLSMTQLTFPSVRVQTAKTKPVSSMFPKHHFFVYVVLSSCQLHQSPVA